MIQNTDVIPFAKPSMGEEEEEKVLDVLRSGWLTTGKQCLEFEKEFASYVKAPYAIALNSATAGLHLALEALGVKAGQKVITTVFTFTASAEVIRYCGAEPVFIDINPKTLNMDIEHLKKTYQELVQQGQDIVGIIPVHIGGSLEGFDEIYNFAKDKGLFIVEDAAHCFPVKSPKGYAGTLSDIGVYSFYANKTMTTGEGGMLVCSDPQIANRVKNMRLHGIDRTIWNRFTAQKAKWEYDVIAPGFKYNLTDIAAAIGRVQLKKAESFLNKRKEIALFYKKELQNCSFLNLPSFYGDHSWHLFIITLNINLLEVDRNEFINLLQDNGVGVSVHYKPLHMMSYYKKRYHFSDEDFPVALNTFNRCLSLPIYPDMTIDEQKKVVEVIKKIGKRGEKRNGTSYKI